MKIITLKDNTNLTFDGSEDIILLGFNAKDSNIVLNIHDGDEVNVYGLFILNNKDSISLKTQSNHLSKNSKSRVHIKAVLGGEAILNYEGMINIEEHSVSSDAYLQNENLILSDECTVNSSPQLEIKNNLVKASHGVATSTVNVDQLEYLMSRGINEKDATILIVNGFVEEIASMLPEEMYEQIQKRLSNFF